MTGNGYSNAASGFGADVGYSTPALNDTAAFYDSAGNATFYAYADYANTGQPLAGMMGSGYSNLASGFATNVATSTSGGTDTAEFFDSVGNATFYAYGGSQPSTGMYGSYSGVSYSNAASGFGTNLGSSTAASGDTADLFGSTGSNTLYTDAAIALLYGGNYAEQATGFQVVNAIGPQGSVNTKVQGSARNQYTLNEIGTWSQG